MITPRRSDPRTVLSSTPGRFALTVAVCTVIFATSIAALLSSTLMTLFTRDLAQLHAGQWWRAFTPVVVQPDGWGQLTFNLLGLAVVGAALEKRVSRPCWAMVFLLGGAGSIAVSSAWKPGLGGGGSSDAVAALLGAFIVFPVTGTRRSWPDWPAQLYAVFFVVYLTTMDLAGLTASIIVGNASIIVFVLARRTLRSVVLSQACLVLVAAGGVLMTVAQDGHGTGILAGLATALVVLVRRWLLQRYDSPRVAYALFAVWGVWALTCLVWVGWVRLLGVDLVIVRDGNARSEVGLVSVSTAAIAACLSAWVALQLLQRRWPHAGARAWAGLCTAVGAVSLAGPLMLATGSSSTAALIVLHLTCWAGVLALLVPPPKTGVHHPGDVAHALIHGSTRSDEAALARQQHSDQAGSTHRSRHAT